MKFLNQEHDSRTCGQTSLAMILERTTEEICQQMGTKGGTRTKDLLRVLDEENIEVKNRKLLVISKNNPLPKYAILHLRLARKTKRYWGHWSVLKDGMVYDPSPLYIGPTPLEVYLRGLEECGIKVASFLELA